MLRELHAINPVELGPEVPRGVIQHGDFGPNNVIFDADPIRVTAVLDWEFSRIGPALTDVAWCEWIVRMHHPAAVGSLRHFFAAYGARPTWSQRQTEMLRRCAELEDFCRDWAPDHPGVAQWQLRREQVGAWQPLDDDLQ